MGTNRDSCSQIRKQKTIKIAKHKRNQRLIRKKLKRKRRLVNSNKNKRNRLHNRKKNKRRRKQKEVLIHQAAAVKKKKLILFQKKISRK